MKHLNNNLLCVVTAFVTGIDHQANDIIQICVVPLDEQFRVHRDILPFTAMMKKRRHNINKEFLGHDYGKIEDILRKGLDPYFVADALLEWFDRYKKRFNKKIMVLAYNWALIRAFLIDWLGLETFEIIFDYRYRDIMSASIYLNDRAYWHSEDYPFPKHNLVDICNRQHVDYHKKYDVMQQSMAIAEAYKKMLSTWVGV